MTEAMWILHDRQFFFNYHKVSWSFIKQFEVTPPQIGWDGRGIILSFP
jgi:hypothetical protein